MSEPDLRVLFPKLEPTSGAPALFRLNGCGFGMYGKMDRHRETGTYLSVHCACMFWIPVFPLFTYRVADAENGGWYFIGKEPGPPAFQAARVVVLALIALLVFGAWQSTYKSSPEYAAKQSHETAEFMIESKSYANAANLLRRVIQGGTDVAPDARETLSEMIQTVPVDLTAEDHWAVFEVGYDPTVGLDVEAVYVRMRALVEELAQTDPQRAVGLWDALGARGGTPERNAQIRSEIVKAAAARHPTDPWVVSEQALALEEAEDFDGCEQLLNPLRDKLGAHEGARILGQIDAAAGRFDEAVALLDPYSRETLRALHAAETVYSERVTEVQESALETLRNGNAPESWYVAYDRADEAGQQAQVDEFIGERINVHPGVQKAYDDLRALASVVPVAIDLAMARLQRARGMTDAIQRKRELEAAETTFLAVQGLASGDPNYLLALGQVKYWLGQEEAGSALLDEAIASSGGAFQIQFEAANVLREVGAVSRMRTLLTTMYDEYTDAAQRTAIASTLAACATTPEDSLKWLRLADQDSPWVRASLSNALGSEAAVSGDYDAAAAHFRAAAEAYDSFPRSASALNNGALAWTRLYGMTGKRSDFDEGAKRMVDAVSESPDDSVLLRNATAILMTSATLDLLSETLGLEALRLSSSTSLLGQLYNDEAGQIAVSQKLAAHERTKEARAMVERLIVLSPQSAFTYAQAAELYSAVNDVAALKTLHERIGEVRIDVNDQIALVLEHLSPENAAKRESEARTALSNAVRRYGPLRDTTSGATRAFATMQIVLTRHSAARVGIDIDFDETVAMAEEAYRESPSQMTGDTLELALLARAERRLAGTLPEFAAESKRCRLTVSAYRMIAATLHRGGALAVAVAKDRDVVRFLELLAASRRRYPTRGSSTEWAYLVGTDPAAAAELAKVINARGASVPRNDIDARCAPTSAADALSACWSFLIAGDTERARQALETCAATGVPVPFHTK